VADDGRTRELHLGMLQALFPVIEKDSRGLKSGKLRGKVSA
jgi:hypothetical protein